MVVASVDAATVVDASVEDASDGTIEGASMMTMRVEVDAKPDWSVGDQTRKISKATGVRPRRSRAQSTVQSPNSRPVVAFRRKASLTICPKESATNF